MLRRFPLICSDSLRSLNTVVAASTRCSRTVSGLWHYIYWRRLGLPLFRVPNSPSLPKTSNNSSGVIVSGGLSSSAVGGIVGGIMGGLTLLAIFGWLFNM